jgi:hypothetical protein
MNMTINLTCACGARIEISDTRGSFINAGGRHNAEGRVYQIELIADRWLKEHSTHGVLLGGGKTP